MSNKTGETSTTDHATRIIDQLQQCIKSHTLPEQRQLVLDIGKHGDSFEVAQMLQIRDLIWTIADTLARGRPRLEQTATDSGYSLFLRLSEIVGFCDLKIKKRTPKAK